MRPPGGQEFPTTSWSLIRRAANLDVPESRSALATLCEAYWYPLYAYLRRAGQSSEDAEDLVQEFFARLLQAKRLEQLSPDRGSFRGFLLVALKNFVSTEATRVRTQKRGGGRAPLPFSLDMSGVDQQYRLESHLEGSPDSPASAESVAPASPLESSPVPETIRRRLGRLHPGPRGRRGASRGIVGFMVASLFNAMSDSSLPGHFGRGRAGSSGDL
jgi:DNA-directed RNA polymerase specialized sigma24 family protein